MRCSVTYVVTHNHYQEETIKRKKRIEGNKNKKRRGRENKNTIATMREKEKEKGLPRHRVIS